MPITVERYWDLETLEIKLAMPQGDSFIVAGKHSDDSYDLSVFLPWYVGRHSIGVGLCLEENLDREYIQSLSEDPTYELIALIRKSLPALERLDRENDLEA